MHWNLHLVSIQAFLSPLGPIESQLDWPTATTTTTVDFVLNFMQAHGRKKSILYIDVYSPSQVESKI
jgi:hypothetical protein